MTSTTFVTILWTGFASFLFILITTLFLIRLATKHVEQEGEKRRFLLALLKDSGGWPSLAVFQLVLWGAIVAFAVLWVSSVRLVSGLNVLMPEIPANLLAILLISVGVTPGSAYMSNKKYTWKPSSDDAKHKNHWHSMLQEKASDGKYYPSPTRVQMLLWTVVAVIIYFISLVATMSSAETLMAIEGLSLPDLDEVFLVLMGLSQTGYLGGKAVAKGPRPSQTRL